MSLSELTPAAGDLDLRRRAGVPPASCELNMPGAGHNVVFSMSAVTVGAAFNNVNQKLRSKKQDINGRSWISPFITGLQLNAKKASYLARGQHVGS